MHNHIVYLRQFGTNGKGIIMNEEKRKRKQEKRKIWEINNSLRYLSNSVQKEIGILAVQEQDNVFLCGDKIYKKVYTVRPTVLQNKKYEFIKALCNTFHHRIRLIQILKNNGEKLGSYMFMTVFFEAETYYEAKKEIEEFEKKLKMEIALILHIDIQTCTLDSVLSYMFLNYSGKMQQLDVNQLFTSKSGLQIFDTCKNTENGKFSFDGNYGIACIGKNYPEEMPELTKLFNDQKATYQICIDFQSYCPEDKEIYQLALNRRYCNEKIELDKTDIVNMSFLLIAINNDSDLIDGLADTIFDYYDDMSVMVMPGVDRGRDIFLSTCSLGMRDFHSMQNSDVQTISNLFM